MPFYHGRIAIAGVAESDYGRVPQMTEMELHAQATRRALVNLSRGQTGLRRLTYVSFQPSFSICLMFLIFLDQFGFTCSIFQIKDIWAPKIFIDTLPSFAYS